MCNLGRNVLEVKEIWSWKVMNFLQFHVDVSHVLYVNQFGVEKSP